MCKISVFENQVTVKICFIPADLEPLVVTLRLIDILIGKRTSFLYVPAEPEYWYLCNKRKSSRIQVCLIACSLHCRELLVSGVGTGLNVQNTAEQ